MIFPKFDYTYESDNLKCPYCGQENNDAWEIDFDDDSIEMECDCGKKFWGERIVRINYKGQADCELNNEKHDLESTGNKGQWICKVCGRDVYDMNKMKEEFNLSKIKEGKKE